MRRCTRCLVGCLFVLVGLPSVMRLRAEPTAIPPEAPPAEQQAVMLAPPATNGTAPGTPAQDLKVSASAWENKAAGGWADFPPANTLDGDLGDKSSWRAEAHDEAGQWIQYDLGKTATLTAVRLAFVGGDTRRYRFKIETSADGAAWSSHFDGESSGKTKDFERYAIPDAAARYVKVTGFGSTHTKFPKWINITEAELLIQE